MQSAGMTRTSVSRLGRKTLTFAACGAFAGVLAAVTLCTVMAVIGQPLWFYDTLGTTALNFAQTLAVVTPQSMLVGTFGLRGHARSPTGRIINGFGVLFAGFLCVAGFASGGVPTLSLSSLGNGSPFLIIFAVLGICLAAVTCLLKRTPALRASKPVFA